MYIKSLSHRQANFFQRTYNFFETNFFRLKSAHEILILASYLQFLENTPNVTKQLKCEESKKTKTRENSTELLNTPKSKY